ncbi:hypothetical protein QMU91_002461 [Flavobacterium psychrophilum]|nr:hypothetical protein [Flavobacterium psychrophilum]
MKKLLLFAFLTISIIACKDSSTQNKVEITFKDLDLMKSKPINEIEEYLQKCNYNSLNNQFSNQWKSGESEDVVQFNDKGVLVFLTYNHQTFEKLIIDLKKSTYIYSGKKMKNSLEVETYTKNQELIFLSTMINPEDGKKVYSLTFI